MKIPKTRTEENTKIYKENIKTAQNIAEEICIQENRFFISQTKSRTITILKKKH